MNFTEMEDAIKDAQRTIRNLESQSNEIAKMLDSTIYNVKNFYGKKALASIKKKLKNFNAKTYEWKN